jgi:hypothetical protein
MAIEMSLAEAVAASGPAQPLDAGANFAAAEPAPKQPLQEKVDAAALREARMAFFDQKKSA